ncbi:hypothetical protein CEP54_001484 [Fusarium duplospermum]|uniref:Uncharacterized protein n=1 Tax=Fusarium duplospermum TaxID=1325734 RepID=A0A428R164_9HYPO|nr:hypothetical protein CEP54_001484 [Fusarium duplospermum]
MRGPFQWDVVSAGKPAHHLDLQTMRLLRRPGEMNMPCIHTSPRRLLRLGGRINQEGGKLLLAWLPCKWQRRTTPHTRYHGSLQTWRYAIRLRCRSSAV